MADTPLRAQLQELFALLQQTEPLPKETDVAWWGPYFIARARHWGTTRFSIYRGTLYCALWFHAEHYGLKWNLKTQQIEFESEWNWGEYPNGEWLWRRVATQLITRLKRALQSPEAYNRQVNARMPPQCRTGKILRSLTWPSPKLSRKTLLSIREFEAALAAGHSRPRLKSLCAQDYLNTAAIAYDAVFPELASLSALRKYKARADGRHGGLLKLSKKSSKAFKAWFHSSDWAGAHPFEIIFGLHHGVMLYPNYHDETGTWSYSLSAGTEGYYSKTMAMASALASAEVPFEIYGSEEILAALRGEDYLGIGTGSRGLYYEELRQINPKSLKHILWDPLPVISRISEAQRLRVASELASVGTCED